MSAVDPAPVVNVPPIPRQGVDVSAAAATGLATTVAGPDARLGTARSLARATEAGGTLGFRGFIKVQRSTWSHMA